MAEFNFNGDILPDEYAEIWRWFGWEDVVCPGDIRNLCETAAGEELTIFINSDGGSLIAGTEIYSILHAYRGRKTAHIQSRAASAATVAMMACERILAEPVSLICVHNPYTYASGDADEMRHTAEELDNIKRSIVNAYEPRIKVPRAEIEELMNKNLWLDAAAAKGYGLVDEIVGETAPANEPVPAGMLLNTAGRVRYPTQKMIDEYRAAKQGAADAEKAAKAWLENYRH